MVTDTACSSSNVALYQAVRALQAGDCKSAVVGGVNVLAGADVCSAQLGYSSSTQHSPH